MLCEFEDYENGVKCKNCGYILKNVKGKVNRSCTISYPSLGQQAINFSKAVWNYAMDGFRNVEDEEKERRLGICKTCPFYDELQDRCKSCGCNSSLKTRIASSNCPRGLW